MAATIFDAAHTGANITLSGGSLVATVSTGGSFVNTVSTNRQTTGKYYFEIVATLVNGNDWGFGLSNSSMSNTDFLGHTADAFGIFKNGDYWINNVQHSASFISWGTGDRINVAVDIGASLIWLSHNNSGIWNNNVVNDPATGVGGFSIAGLNANSYGPGFDASTLNSAVTAHFSSASWISAAPSGFISFDPIIPTAVYRRTLSQLGTRTGSRQAYFGE